MPHLKDTRGGLKFLQACANLGFYFDNYVGGPGAMSCRVFTVRQNRYMERVADIIYLTRGDGHDIVSCSISGLRRSGRSSLEAWLAALGMQMYQLVESMDGRAQGVSPNHTRDAVER